MKKDEDDEVSPMQAALKLTDRDWRMEEMALAAENEMNIN
jgi:hypothetical protein